MNRSDKRRIERGQIICDNGHWFKLMHNGKIRTCPKCKEFTIDERNSKETEQTDKGKRTTDQAHRTLIRPMD